MRRKILSFVVVVVLASVTIGCGCRLSSLIGGKAKEVVQTVMATAVQQVEPTSAGVATATPVAAQANTSTPQPDKPRPDGNAGPAEVSHDSLQVLDSYRYQFTVDTTEAGVRTVMTASGAFVREPPGMLLDALSTEGDQPGVVIKIIQTAGSTYVFDQEQGGWLALPFDPQASGGMSMFGDLMDEFDDPLQEDVFTVVAAHEQASGVDCRHHHADAKDLPQDVWSSDVTTTGGDVDVWVANDLGYIARMVMDVKGQKENGDPTVAKFEMQLSDVNEPIQISPPPDGEIVQDMRGGDVDEVTPVPGTTEGIAATLPRPDDAKILTESLPAQAQAFAQGGDIDLYETHLPVAETVAFVEEAYPQAGWDAQEAMPMGEMRLLTFSKEGRTATVMVMPGESSDQSLVIVSVE